VTARIATAAAALAAAMTAARTLLVIQVRQALQQAVAIGAWSPTRVAIGSILMPARSSTPRVYARREAPGPSYVCERALGYRIRRTRGPRESVGTSRSRAGT